LRSKNIKRIFIVLIIIFNSPVLTAQVTQEETDFIYGKRLYEEQLYDLAAIQFEKFVKDYPDSPRASEAQFLLADSYFLKGEFKDAIEQYSALIIRFPQSMRIDLAQFRIGKCFENIGKKKQAVSSYFRVYQDYPESKWADRALYRSAQLTFNSGDLIKSESILRTLLDHSSGRGFETRASFLLADIYIRRQEYSKATKILNRFVDHPIGDGDREEALFRIGMVNETIGLYPRSEACYKAITERKLSDTLTQKSWFRLGLLYVMQGMDEDAVKAFESAASIDMDKDLTAEAILNVGRIRLRQNDLKSALQSFIKADKITQSSSLKYETGFEIAYCLQKMGDADQSIQKYEALLKQDAVDLSIKKKAVLMIAKLLRDSGDYQKALSWYQDYIIHFKDDRLIPFVLLSMGRIYIDNMKQWDEGFKTLRRIWESYPQCIVVPEARLLYAEALESLKRYKEALLIYKSIQEGYPSSREAEISKERVRFIDSHSIVDVEHCLSGLADMIEQSILSPDRARLYYKLGKISMYKLKQYREAVEFFNKYLSNKNIKNKEEVIYYKARCYEALSEINTNDTYLDSALSLYNKVINEFPKSIYFENSVLSSIRLEKEKGKEIDLERYYTLSDSFLHDDKRAEMIYLLSVENVEKDSLSRAAAMLDTLLKEFPQNKDAIYKLAEIKYRERKFNVADSLVRIVLDDDRYRPGTLFLSSMIALESGDYGRAISMLENIKEKYPNSKMWEMSIVPLGELYLKENSYSKVISLYTEVLKKDSVLRLGALAGLCDRPELERERVLSGLALAYEKSGDLKNAKKYYFYYIKNYYDFSSYNTVLISLAKIAEKEGMIACASDYLNMVIKRQPSDTTISLLGDFQFRMGNYHEAASIFDRALTMSGSSEKKAEFSSKVIVSLLRQGKIPQAEVRIKIFKKSFIKDPHYREYLARFELEKGRAYIKKKEFELAEQSIKSLIDRYGDTGLIQDGEFELGRIYLVTNKTKDALEILTKMIKKYPDHPILAKVYLNLGDHYYRSRQLENAMGAFKTIVENYKDSEVAPVAMRYLVKVYETLQMWDGAMVMCRRYIENFPDTKDAVDMRVKIGNYYMNLMEYKRAIEYFRELKKEVDFETEAEIQYWIAKSYYNMGQFEKAIFEFLKVQYISKPTKMPWATTSLYEAGKAYMKINQPDNAKRLFEKIVRKEGAASEWGRFALQRIQEIENMNRMSRQD